MAGQAKEFCHVNFPGRRHHLYLTDQEEAQVRLLSTEREVIRMILLKFYTPMELQYMTLHGRGFGGKARPKIPLWLVELITRAVDIVHPLGRVDDPSVISRLDCEVSRRLRQKMMLYRRLRTRRTITSICQYYRRSRTWRFQ